MDYETGSGKLLQDTDPQAMPAKFVRVQVRSRTRRGFVGVVVVAREGKGHNP